MGYIQDWREYDPPTAEAIQELQRILALGEFGNEERITTPVKAIGLLDALEARIAYAELLVGTGICPYCETCLGCGAPDGPPGRHDDDCLVVKSA